MRIELITCFHEKPIPNSDLSRVFQQMMLFFLLKQQVKKSQTDLISQKFVNINSKMWLNLRIYFQFGPILNKKPKITVPQLFNIQCKVER